MTSPAVAAIAAASFVAGVLIGYIIATWIRFRVRSEPDLSRAAREHYARVESLRQAKQQADEHGARGTIGGRPGRP